MKKENKTGWQIAIDLTGEDQEENIPFIYSQVFKTEQQADNWYRKLEDVGSELYRYNKGVDVIMIHWVNGSIEDTYLI